jgi:hypothetical protein
VFSFTLFFCFVAWNSFAYGQVQRASSARRLHRAKAADQRCASMHFSRAAGQVDAVKSNASVCHELFLSGVLSDRKFYFATQIPRRTYG